MKDYKYLKKEIIRDNDLVPKGIKSTYDKEKTDFNSTFIHIWKNLK